MRFGSLFAGIGGLDLGLERAGMECVWQVENDDYATQVLEKHWPDVARYGDVRECGEHNLDTVDLICAGWPCQDLSRAGSKKGLNGERSGLWSEAERIFRELRPRYILLENVADLLRRGAGTILGDLAASGYDAEWQVLPAAALGAPHLRERVFVLAYPNGEHVEGVAIQQKHAGSLLREGEKNRAGIWLPPDGGFVRVADGPTAEMDRIRGIGNAVVPAVAQWIGERIMEAAAP